MSNIRRVYIGGPLTPRGFKNDNPAIDYLTNVRDMLRCGLEVLQAGFIPFIPALDFSLFLILRQGEKITEQMIKDYSIAWLDVCDAMVLTPFYEESPGTLREIKYALEHRIPVFNSLEDLIRAVNSA